MRTERDFGGGWLDICQRRLRRSTGQELYLRVQRIGITDVTGGSTVLMKLSELDKMLARTEDPVELKRGSVAIEALREMAKRSRLSLSIVNQAFAERVKWDRKRGAWIAENIEKGQSNQYAKSPAPTLHDIETSKDDSSYCQKLIEITDEKVLEYVGKCLGRELPRERNTLGQFASVTDVTLGCRTVERRCKCNVNQLGSILPRHRRRSQYRLSLVPARTLDGHPRAAAPGFRTDLVPNGTRLPTWTDPGAASRLMMPKHPGGRASENPLQVERGLDTYAELGLNYVEVHRRRGYLIIRAGELYGGLEDENYRGGPVSAVTQGNDATAKQSAEAEIGRSRKTLAQWVRLASRPEPYRKVDDYCNHQLGILQEASVGGLIHWFNGIIATKYTGNNDNCTLAWVIEKVGPNFSLMRNLPPTEAYKLLGIIKPAGEPLVSYHSGNNDNYTLATEKTSPASGRQRPASRACRAQPHHTTTGAPRQDSSSTGRFSPGLCGYSKRCPSSASSCRLR